MAPGLLDLPDELTSQVLLSASTPTFIQLIRTCKKFYTCARQNRNLLIHHLRQIPGDKTKLQDGQLDNHGLFLLLRQRAVNTLNGVNFTANMHEHVARSVSIDPKASSVGGLDAEYVRMALSFRDSLDIRQYTNHGVIKEKIKQIATPHVKILKLVQWGRFVSVLCSWPARKDDELDDASDSEDSDSETEMLVKEPLPPTVNAHLQRTQRRLKSRNDRLITIIKSDFNYRIIHFDVYTMEDSRVMEIIPPPDSVPRDFAVHNCSLCAILWDKETPGNRPTEDASVLTYTIDARMGDIVYEQKTVWPKANKPTRTSSESDDDDDAPEQLPESIAFFKEGRRIKMYDAGGIVPYQTFSASTTQYDQYASTNVISFEGFTVHVDTPFYGTHTTQLDDLNQQSYCFQHHLCLGIASLNLPNHVGDDEVRILCVLRSQNRYYPESCDHRVNFSRMTHVSANNSTIVARLWGWEPLHTNLSGKETVAVSPGGTRIAIAMWNKVLVYPLNPKVLCDEAVVDSSDDEAPKPRRKRKKPQNPWEKPCTDYYLRKKDKNLLGWKIAELRPIVLDLQGAVAHKMSWSAAKEPITDTLDPPPTSNPVANDAENEAVNAEQDSTEPIVESLGGSSASVEQPVEHGLEASSVEVQQTPQEVDEKATAQETIPNPSEAAASQSIEAGASSTEVSGNEVLDLTQGGETHPATGELAIEMQSGEVSPPEPQSPTQPTKKLDAAQVPGTLANIVPSPPPTNPTTFTTALPGIPFSSYGAQNTSQPSKLSTRKKDKAPETNNTQINASLDLSNLATFEKKSEFLAQGPSDKYGGVENVPAFLSLTKSGPKPSQTVAEALSSTGLTATTVPVGSVANTVVGTSAGPVPSSTEQNTGGSASSPLETGIGQQANGSDEENVSPNLSKSPSISPTSQAKCHDDIDKAETKHVKHRKRITEDELIILTDRGVQIWNLGARAKGKRKKSNLKLEESLKGKLPRMKGKKKEAVTAVEDED